MDGGELYRFREKKKENNVENITKTRRQEKLEVVAAWIWGELQVHFRIEYILQKVIPSEEEGIIMKNVKERGTSQWSTEATRRDRD